MTPLGEDLFLRPEVTYIFSLLVLDWSNASCLLVENMPSRVSYVSKICADTR